MWNNDRIRITDGYNPFTGVDRFGPRDICPHLLTSILHEKRAGARGLLYETGRGS